jgi:type IV secretory pathway VirB6-like protein
MSDNIKTYIYQFSAVIVLLSAILFSSNPLIAPYALGVGALGVTIATLLRPYPGKHFRGKRLFNMQVLGGLFMVAAAVFMYFGLKYWVICLLIGAILTLYAAIMIPRVLKQEKEDSLK